MDCYTCARTGDPAGLAPRELIGGDDHWRVAHAFGTALPGWLVLVPRRHVTSIAELTDDEAASLGRWQVRVSRALGEVTGCAKTYVAQFAEAEGFAHVHFHIVPRSSDHPEELRGPRVFGLLGKGAGTPVTPEEMDRLALLLRAALADR
ncbi:diadenosine tetraphosphate (Ap4A) HIT family hydrolase [Streptomyces sp. TLI_235]|nr:HIT family protein [Streptomyces sp. TLI_235]PBC79617.1 diadenosine tetraphosphate (Ap4A) HIT family hydrolase [Streptomyces sp. TLI_235]